MYRNDIMVELEKKKKDNPTSGLVGDFFFVGKHMSRISLLLSYFNLFFLKKEQKQPPQIAFFSHITFYSRNCAFFFHKEQFIFLIRDFERLRSFASYF